MYTIKCLYTRYTTRYYDTPLYSIITPDAISYGIRHATYYTLHGIRHMLCALRALYAIQVAYATYNRYAATITTLYDVMCYTLRYALYRIRYQPC